MSAVAAEVLQPVVLAVDDDPWFLRALIGNLEDSGYSARGFTDGNQLIAYLGTGQSGGIVLLDWQMPAPDGPEVLRRLRAAGCELPVLFLTGLNQPVFEEAGLSLGAVDFVDKTKSFSIILHRLRIVLDGGKGQAAANGNGHGGGEEQPASAGLVYGPLRVDGARAYWRNGEVPLTHSEFVIVRHLAGKPGKDVSYREIYDLLRGPGFRAGSGEDGYRTNVRAIVTRIRQKFRQIDEQFEALENYAGYGYRWREETGT